MGSIGGYNFGYDECSYTTNFATSSGLQDIAQSEQHTLLTPPSHHQATLYFSPEDVGSVGGYKIVYDECSCTTNFATAPGRQYIARVLDTMVPPSLNQSKQHT